MREFVWQFGVSLLNNTLVLKKLWIGNFKLSLRERNWMPKFEACSRIRKRLVTIWIFPYICFDFRCSGETQLTTEKCMEKIKLQQDAFVCTGYMPKLLAFRFSLVTLKFSVHNLFETRVLLKIFDAEFPNKLSYFEPLCHFFLLRTHFSK